MEFEWDDAKARANLVKHGVPFDYAVRVFDDPDCLDIDTIRPVDGESRRKIIGLIEGRLFAVVYVMREDVCRIISARRTNKTEDRSYGNHPLHA